MAMRWFEDPEQIKLRRSLLGLTQKELAKAAGVERTWLVMVEGGNIQIAHDKARANVKDKVNRIWKALARFEAERKPKELVPLAALGKPVPSNTPAPTAERIMTININLAIGRRLAELERRGLNRTLVDAVEKRVAEKLRDIAERQPALSDLVVELWGYIVELEGDIALLEDRVNQRDGVSRELVDDAIRVKA